MQKFRLLGRSSGLYNKVCNCCKESALDSVSKFSKSVMRMQRIMFKYIISNLLVFQFCFTLHKSNFLSPGNLHYCFCQKRISVSPLIKHLCGKLILFSPTLKLVPTPIQFRIRCLNQRCMITFFSRFLLDNDRNEKKNYKSIDKNKYCPYLFFFISDCCLFKIKRNNRISFISNIIERKKIFRYIIHVYIDFLF